MKYYKLFKTILILLLATVAGGNSAWATSTFKVTNPTGSTFRITRTGNTSVPETVNWRIVSLSALEGIHYTGVLNGEVGVYSGMVSFNANDTYKDITVNEITPSGAYAAFYSYQTSSDRSYRFEVLDKDGYILASKDRSITTGTSINSANAFGLQDIVVNSGTDTITDANYSQAYHAVPVATFFSNTAPKSYLVTAGAELRMTLTFQAKEHDDGYQHVQILVNQTSNHDEGAGDNQPGNMNYSSYMATFCHQGGSQNGTYASYSFPVTSVGNRTYNKKDPLYYAWTALGNNVGDLRNQTFKTNCRADDGRLIISSASNLSNFSTLGYRFDASGDNHDTWYAHNTVAHIQAVDVSAPLVLNDNNYKVSGGRHQKGNIIYVSVPFNEIVTITGSPKKLTTSWGDLTYIAGNGTNVLTFSGKISSSASGTLKITGMSGTITDLAGNSFSTPWTPNNPYDLGTVLDADYTWSVSDFRLLPDNTYEIYTKVDLRHLALLVNKSNQDCRGLTFKQTANTINCDNTYIPIGYYNSTHDYSYFSGTYDGQGKTISNISVSRTGTSDGDGYVGLFGYISSGTVKDVVLTNCTFTGKDNVGGIAGFSSSGTVRNCSVESNVTINAGTNGAKSHGGIVGNNEGYIIGCLSAATINNNNNTNHLYCGGIAGTQSGTIRDCLYTGTTIEANNNKGAIAGRNSNGTPVYTNNYYTSVNIGGVGAEGSSSDCDGARRAYAVTWAEDVVLVGDETAYDLSGLTAVGTGNYALRYGSTLYSGEGQLITFRHNGVPTTGYVWDGFSATNGGTFTGNTLTMPADNVTVMAAFRDVWGVTNTPAADGTAEHPYLISDTTGLNLLARNVNDPHGYNTANNFQDKHFMLANNITYTHTTDWDNSNSTESNYTAIGYNSHPFCGTFDGDGDTISGIRIYKRGTTNADDYQGLFGLVSGGTIKNLTLTDARITGYNEVGGIAGNISKNDSTHGIIENCHVTGSVTLNSVVDHACWHGGIVGRVNRSSVSGCSSAATLSYVSGHTLFFNYGGIAGELNGDLQNCLVLGANISGTDNVGAVVGIMGIDCDQYTVTANYYRGCTVNGTANATNVGVGAESTVSFTPHDCDGIRSLHTLTLPSFLTASSADTLVIDNVTYYAAGVTVTVTPLAGLILSSVSVNGTDATYHSDAGTWTITMPAADATVSPAISYIDADGSTQTCTNFSLIESSNSNVTYGTEGQECWFVVSGNVTIGDKLNLQGSSQHLILCDGATLTINSSTYAVYSRGGSSILTLYGQANGTGALNAATTNTGVAAIEVDGSLIINGGLVNASGGFDGINSKNATTINGGSVNASGSHSGIRVLLQNITLGWRSLSDRIYATSYGFPVIVKAGQCFTDGTAAYSGTLTGTQINALAGQTLQPCFAITLPEHVTATGVISQNGTTAYALADATVTLGYSGTVPTGDVVAYSVGSDNLLGNTFTMPASDVTVTASLITEWVWLNRLFAAASTNSENPTLITLDQNYTAQATDTYLTIPSGRYVTLDLNGHTLDRALTAATSNGYVILVNGTLTVNDGSNPSTGTITGGNNIIYDINGNYGGGVRVDGGSFTMNGGKIYGNTAGNYGGGVSIANGGSFTLSGGTVSNNSASNGSGVHVYNGCTFTMSGGSITGNIASHGVYVNGTFTMSGGTISNNTQYGGVYVDGTFTMSGGSISNNSSTWGGGVRVNSGSFTMSGGSITGNTASYYGGGVYCSGTFQISGSPVITGNTNGANGPADNVYLYNGKVITVTDALTNTARIGVTMQTTGVFTSGLSGRGTAANFTSDNSDYSVCQLNGNGEAAFGYDVYIADGITGGTVSTDQSVAPVNATVTITIAPVTGYALTGLTMNGTDVTASVVNSQYTFTMPAQDVTINATFTDHWGVTAGADGTLEHPYLITTPEGLVLLSDRTNAGNSYNDIRFRLGADIDMIGVANFNPIRDFHGVFDGDRYTISHLTINKPDQNSVGLFNLLAGNTVRNVTLDHATITGNNYVGAIAGDDKYGPIYNCIVLNSTVVSGTYDDLYDYVGAIVGSYENSYDLVRNYYHNCTVVRRGYSYTTNIGTNTGDIDDDNHNHRAVEGDIFSLSVTAGQWQAIASPLNNDGFSEWVALTDLPRSSYDLFAYFEQDAKWENMKNLGFLQHGKGYIYRAATSGTRTFYGKAYDGDCIAIAFYRRCGTDALKGFNLVGNPYNQPISFSDISVSSGNGAIAPGYYTLEPDGSWQAHTSGTIAPGQAVLFQVTEPQSGGNSATITINRPTQSKGGEEVESGKMKVESLAFTVSDGEHSDVAYAVWRNDNDNQNENQNQNEKGLRKFGHQNADLPSLSIVEGDGRYAIAPIADSVESFDLAFRGKAGEYTLTVRSSEVGGRSYVHLIDRLTGADIDLLKDSAYTFVRSEVEGQRSGARFLVRFSPFTSHLSPSEAHFAHLDGEEVVIEGEGTLTAYDVMGRELFRREIKNEELRMKNSDFPCTGVYVLRLGGKSQKIVIK